MQYLDTRWQCSAQRSVVWYEIITVLFYKNALRSKKVYEFIECVMHVKPYRILKESISYLKKNKRSNVAMIMIRHAFHCTFAVNTTEQKDDYKAKWFNMNCWSLTGVRDKFPHILSFIQYVLRCDVKVTSSTRSKRESHVQRSAQCDHSFEMS